jgi:PIN domain nuclease of toxin-antitoxin system
MQLLVDTHLLLWSVAASKRLSAKARALLTDPANDVLYSAASVWEIAIKSGLGRADFKVDLPALLRAFEAAGFVELAITAAHAARVISLPDLHKDPFDRLLVAQALSEPALLLTNDQQLGPYGAHVQIL